MLRETSIEIPSKLIFDVFQIEFNFKKIRFDLNLSFPNLIFILSLQKSCVSTFPRFLSNLFFVSKFSQSKDRFSFQIYTTNL